MFRPAMPVLRPTICRMLALGLAIHGLLQPTFAADAAPAPLRILLITGGCCHDYTAQKAILADGLRERGHFDIDVVQQGGAATDSKIEIYSRDDWADGYDLVIHDECFSDVTDKAYVDRILKPHRAGKPAVVLHCAMHCYRDGRDDWFKFCGVTSRRHGAHYAHEVLNRDAAHPIMKGFPAGWANPAGELYWIEKVWDTAHPLASAKNREQGNEEVCVWTNQFEQARVFGTTLGHHNETVGDPVYLDLLTRGVLWAAGKQDDPRYLKQASSQPKLVPVNLALNAKASASSEETNKNNLIPHAIDGKDATRWCASGGNPPQWLQIDLGKPQAVKGTDILWESNETFYKYTVEGSADGQAWRLLADHSANGRNKQHVDRFDAPGTQFIRVTFSGSNTGGWASIKELRVFGDEMIEVDPAADRNRREAEFLADVTVPEGFDVSLFAAPPAVLYPVYVAAAPDGTCYVSVDKNGSLDREPHRGAIYRLRDLDGDGRADETKLYVADVDSPRGLVWDHDRLYCMHPPHLSAFIDHDGDGISDEQQVLVKNIAFGFKDRPADHTSNGVTLGIDGWLYLAIGDFGFMEAEGADGTKLGFRSGGVVRVRPDGTGLEVYSRGTRNILEVAMDPLLNGFTRDNTNDGGGWDIRLHHFTGLEHHGYPSLYMNFAAEIVQPLADYGGGSGCGALFLDEPGFPPGYSPALYTADWGRNIVFRHRLTPKGATFTPDQTEFIKSTRVTDLDVDANSALYVTSWKGASFTYTGDEVGYLVKVTPTGYTAEKLPDFDKSTDAELVDLLRSPSHRRRLEAQRTLLRRGLNPMSIAALGELARDQSQPLHTRVAALFTLKQGLRSGLPELSAPMAFQDPQLRPFVSRALGDRMGVGTPWDKEPRPTDAAPALVDPVAIGLIDENPRARLESVVAIARLQLIDLAGEVAKKLDDPDAVVAHTVVRSLVELGGSEACFAIIDEAGLTGPKRDAALRVLQSLHKSDVVDGLLLRLRHETDPHRRQGLLTALCRLHFVEGEWKGNSWGTRPDTSGPYYQPEKWSESDRIAAALRGALDEVQGDEAAFLLTELHRHKVQLDGTLDRALAMAKSNPAMVPAAISEVERARDVPAEAIDLLRTTAADSNAEASLRSQAAICLLRTDDATNFHRAFGALVQLDERYGRQKPWEQLWKALSQPRRLGPQAEWLADAARLDGKTAFWADAALLTLANDKDSSPEYKAKAQQALDSAWGAPARRRQLLEAAGAINIREFEPRVREALRDSDAFVATAAKKLAEQWKLSAEPTPTGPLIKTLPRAEALAAAIKAKGDPAYGQHLFTKISCNKCHTVNKDEPLRGPYLPQVAKTYKRDQLAEAILDPNKTLAQGFVTQVFVLDDGTIVTGFVTAENAEQITLRDKEAKEFTIPVASIEARTKQQISMMPEGLVNDLTVSDLASLLDYLQSIAE
jgi:putative membrane-bound dehydrogenase-like protein